MENASALIVAAIALLACAVLSLVLMLAKRPGWAVVFAGACLACAWVFALEWHELKRARRLKQSPFTTTD